MGLGCSGISAARLLNKQGQKVIVFEQSQSPTVTEMAKVLTKEEIQVELNTPLEIKSFKPFLDDLEKVVISPGIAWNHPILEELRQKRIQITSEISLAWDKLKHFPWIGITGTNGKTTVTSLLHHVLESNGQLAPMAGNVGNAATQLALQLETKALQHPDWLVIELSSYQIEASPEISPLIGIWTNLTTDHLERHGSLDAYTKIKQGLIERSEIRILNADDPVISQQRKLLDNGSSTWISTKGRGTQKNPIDLWINQKGIVENTNGELFECSAFSPPGQHNRQNLLLVTAAALKAGISAKGIEDSLRTFKGLPHRLEPIGKVKNMFIFNDSKATNFHSASKAIEAVSPPSIVIAGGRMKLGDSYQDWLKQINENSCGAVLFGEGAMSLKKIIEGSGFKGPLHCCGGLKEAVQLAFAEGMVEKAQTILFSPACSSFDQYSDFEARGEHFRALIQDMAKQ